MTTFNLESAKSFISSHAETAASPIANVAFKEAYTLLSAAISALESAGSSEPAKPKQGPGRPRQSVADPETYIAARADAISEKCREILNPEKPVKAEDLFKGLQHLMPEASLAQFKQVFGKLLKDGRVAGVASKLGKGGGYLRVATPAVKAA